MKYLNNLLVAGIIVIIFVTTFSFSYQDEGDIMWISDQNSCEAIGGIWNDNNNCSVSNLVIEKGETIHFAAGINSIFRGTINNFGTLEVDINSSIINHEAIINNNAGAVITIFQGGTIINQLGSTINNKGIIVNNLGGSVINEGTIKNNGNITNNGGYITNKGDGSYDECALFCFFRNLISQEGVIVNDSGGNIINLGGIIINTEGAHIFNNNTGFIFNKEGGIIVNETGGVITNNIDANLVNDHSIIYNGVGFINNGRGAIIQNINEGIIFNTKGSHITNSFKGHIVNDALIFNDGGNINNVGGILNNSNKIFNDCGGLILNYQDNSNPIINIPCS